ncbi:MAG: adenine phosphoribosyltransferase [Hyphomonas sp.]
MDLRHFIRTIPDYPKPGIQFRDITTLIGHATAFNASIEALAAPYKSTDISYVAGIEARGFIFGGAVAQALGAGFVPLRKPGKLPYAAISEPYALEYGRDELHLHEDAIGSGAPVLLIDDLLATGGTAEAAVKLLRRAKADIVAAAFVVDLPELNGRKRLEDMGIDVHTLIEFDGH